MSARAVLLLLGGAAGVLGCGEEPAPPVPAPPPASPEADEFARGFSFEVPGSAPRGDPLVVPRPAAQGAYRTRGTFAFVQRARGRFPDDLVLQDREIAGTLDAVRTTSFEGGRRRVKVEGTVETREGPTGAAPPRRSPFRLEFDEKPRGGAERRDVRLTGVPEDVAGAMENVTLHWTEPLPLPDRAVRVGETFPVDVLDVEPLQRALWAAYRTRHTTLPQVTSPIVGASWVVEREPVDGEDAVLLREAARTAPRIEPLDPPGVSSRRLGYADALDRDRRVSLATGVTLIYESTVRTRLRYVEEGADYTVDVESRASLRTTRAE